jgi:GH24 family phage-related lysozyme (muramidase)
MATAIIRTVNIDPADIVKQNAFAILSQIPVNDFNEIKAKLNLSIPGVLGQQTLDKFTEFCVGKLNLTEAGVNAFKDKHGLGNTGALQGVIGPQTAEAFFQELIKQADQAGSPQHINDAGVALVKEFEGLALTAYFDSVHVLTIGYGHTGSDVHVGMHITAQEAEALLRKDMQASESSVRRLVQTPLNSNQFSALVSLVFNIGPGALIKTHLADDLANADFPAAANDILRFDHAGGHVLPGLTRRRIAERKLFLL